MYSNNEENFKIIHGDIIKHYADAIVIPANTEPDITGYGVDGTVYKYAGPELKKARQEIGRINPGWAEVTDAYNLQGFKKIIHTAGTLYFDGNCYEESILRCCYLNSLRQLTNKTFKLESVSIPLLGTGAHDYPTDIAITVAVDELRKFVNHNPSKTVYLVIKDEILYKQADAFRKQIEDFYLNGCRTSDYAKPIDYPFNRSEREGQQIERCEKAWEKITTGQSLDLEDIKIRNANLLNFSCALQLLISDKNNMTPGELQYKSGISHTTFYEIFKGNRKVDSKKNIFLLGICLEASLSEMEILLKSAGFSFTNDPVDTVVETFIRNNNYDIVEINKAIREIDPNLPTFAGQY